MAQSRGMGRLHLANAMYRPHVLAQTGELMALGELSDREQAGMIPVFVVPALPWDPQDRRFTRSLTTHLRGLPERIFRARRQAPCYIDVSQLHDPLLPDGMHALMWMASARVRSQGRFLPLVTERSSLLTLDAAARVFERHRDGIGIRVTARGPDADRAMALESMLAIMGANPEDVDLFIDLGSIEREQRLQAILQTYLSGKARWRSVSIGGRDWPESLPDRPGVVGSPRHTWTNFRRARALAGQQHTRLPGLFDYAGSPPPIRISDGSEHLRRPVFTYTTEDEIFIVQTDAVQRRPRSRESRRSLAPLMQRVMSQESFATPIVTDTDWWIANAARGASPAGPTEWSNRSAHRHLRVALHQLAAQA